MNTEDETQAILDVNNAFYRAFENRDITLMNQTWWQGKGSTCIHPGGNLIQGWDNIRPSWEKIFKNTDSINIETEIIITEIDYAIAYVVVIENVTQQRRGRKVKAQSLATNSFRKMAQQWYLVHHHGSPIINS